MVSADLTQIVIHLLIAVQFYTIFRIYQQRLPVKHGEFAKTSHSHLSHACRNLLKKKNCNSKNQQEEADDTSQRVQNPTPHSSSLIVYLKLFHCLPSKKIMMIVTDDKLMMTALMMTVITQ